MGKAQVEASSTYLADEGNVSAIGHVVNGAMEAIGFGLVIASFGLPLQPQINRVATDLKDLSRFAFSHAIQLDRANDFLPQIVTLCFAHIYMPDSVILLPLVHVLTV